MGHEGHAQYEEKPLGFFVSPLHKPGHKQSYSHEEHTHDKRPLDFLVSPLDKPDNKQSYGDNKQAQHEERHLSFFVSPLHQHSREQSNGDKRHAYFEDNSSQFSASSVYEPDDKQCYSPDHNKISKTFTNFDHNYSMSDQSIKFSHDYSPSEPSINLKHDYKSSERLVESSRPKTASTMNVPFDNKNCALYDNPAFHRHAEATTAELFYDLFFVANLTTFTSMLEINDRDSMTAYIGFFALLWLTWYQTSLYDVRFAADSVFERFAKAMHFGVMVGFAVIGPQWKPGQVITDWKIYKAFGLILMVSRITLFCQYGVTLLYVRKYTKTVVPLVLVMSSTFIAAAVYGALTPAFPDTEILFDAENDTFHAVGKKSHLYIAWYIIGILETILTVCVSCFWRVISFKGTHMVQRMSLLSLIILGEGIIVICKSISKIVKNEFLWTAPVVGQIIAAVLIIYFLYMSYFDRLHEEHFGSIKQQIWSFLHFPLHIALVLVLQGVSLLIIWRQAVEAINMLDRGVDKISDKMVNYTSGEDISSDFRKLTWGVVFHYVPEGVNASVQVTMANNALNRIANGYDNINGTNTTAILEFHGGLNDLFSATFKTLFDSLDVSTPDSGKPNNDTRVVAPSIQSVVHAYYNVFDLVVFYVFIAGGVALILDAILGYLSLPTRKRRVSEYVRLVVSAVAGVCLCLVTLLRYNSASLGAYMESAWMIPTICLVMFICVITNHIRLPKRKVRA